VYLSPLDLRTAAEQQLARCPCALCGVELGAEHEYEMTTSGLVHASCLYLMGCSCSGVDWAEAA